MGHIYVWSRNCCPGHASRGHVWPSASTADRSHAAKAATVNRGHTLRSPLRTGPLGDPLLSGSHATCHDRDAATRGRSHRWPHPAWRRVRRLAHSRSPARDAACRIAAARRPDRSRVRAFLLRQASAIECGRHSGGHVSHPHRAMATARRPPGQRLVCWPCRARPQRPEGSRSRPARPKLRGEGA